MGKKLIILIFMAMLFALVGCGGISVQLYDGETLYKTVQVSVGQEYGFGKPEKTGYRFVGWYDAASGGSALTDGEGSSAGMRWKKENPTAAYARWEAKKYTIVFDYTGATAGDDTEEISVVYGEEITARFPVPQKAGSTFAGWFTQAEGGVQITLADGTFCEGADVYTEEIYPLDGESTTLYAQWTERKITFVFMTQGEPVQSMTCSVGEILYEMPFSVLDGYCFVEWCFDETLLLPMKIPYTVGEESATVVNLYAKHLPGTNDGLQFNPIASTGDREYAVSYSGNAQQLVIPDSYYGKKVTSVSEIRSQTVKEIVLPQTVTELTEGAFENCEALEKVNLPYAVERVPESAFAGCKNLESISLPIGLKEIGAYAFSGCGSIKEIILPGGLSSVGDGAFRDMFALKEFRFAQASERYYESDGVLYYKLGNSASLVQYPAGREDASYEIASDTVRILAYAFSGAKLNTVTIGGKISRLEEGAFANCTELFNVSVTTQALRLTIGDLAFSGCKNLKAIKLEVEEVPDLARTSFDGVSAGFSVYVPSGMMRQYQVGANWRNFADKIYPIGNIFGDFALEEVSGGYAIRQYFGTEEEIVIPDIINAKQIVEIMDGAFSDSSLREVTISANVRKIGANAFANSAGLTAIIVQGEPPQLGQDAFKGIDASFAIYVDGTPELLDAYRAAAGWSAYADRIWSRNN